MRDNPKENLRRLEEELLEEELMDFDEFAEESDEEDLFLKEIYDLIGTEKSNTAYRNYSNNYGMTRSASAHSTEGPMPGYFYDEPEEEAPRKGGNGQACIGRLLCAQQRKAHAALCHRLRRGGGRARHGDFGLLRLHALGGKGLQQLRRQLFHRLHQHLSVCPLPLEFRREQLQFLRFGFFGGAHGRRAHRCAALGRRQGLLFLSAACQQQAQRHQTADFFHFLSPFLFPRLDFPPRLCYIVLVLNDTILQPASQGCPFEGGAFL